MVAMVLWVVTRVLPCGCSGTLGGCYVVARPVARVPEVVARVLLCGC